MSLARHGFRVGSPITSRSTSGYQNLVAQARRSISSSAYRNSYVGSTPITIPQDITIERVIGSKQTDQPTTSSTSSEAQGSLSGTLEDQLVIRGKHGETSIRLYDYMRFVLPAGTTNKASSNPSTTANSSEDTMSVRRRNPPCPEAATSNPFVFTPQPTSTGGSKPSQPSNSSPAPSEASEVTLFVESPTDKHQRQLWGTTRTLIANAIKGQSEGYSIPIYLIGVGYRAALEVDQSALAGAKSVTITNFQGEAGKDGNGKLPNRRIVLRLGYSHPIFVPIPDDITVVVPSPTIIRLWGRDKQRVGQFAAYIRALRKPEVYKGKGVFVGDEKVKMKAGKKK